MKSFQLATAVILATTTMAMAQDKVQISYSGVLSVEHLSGTDFREDYFHGNGDVSFRWSTASDLKFGADFGIETFGLFDNAGSFTDLSAYYASGIIEGQFGKFHIGMPRGIMDDYFSVPAMAGSELFDLEMSILSHDLFRYLRLLSDEVGENVFGLRYDGGIGQIEVAASVSNFSEYIGNFGELVVRYDAGQWSVTLGTSLFEVDGSSVNSTSLEVQGSAGKFTGGIVYNKTDAIISYSDSARAFISYDVSDAVKINAQVLNYQFVSGSDDSFYAFDLLYKHKTGAFVNAGVLTNETLADNIFNVSVGYKF
jgi:Gram-negative porin